MVRRLRRLCRCFFCCVVLWLLIWRRFDDFDICWCLRVVCVLKVVLDFLGSMVVCGSFGMLGFLCIVVRMFILLILRMGRLVLRICV